MSEMKLFIVSMLAAGCIWLLMELFKLSDKQNKELNDKMDEFKKKQENIRSTNKKVE